MADFTLFIGNKNYSSWSLRPWLALKAAGVDFEEVLIALGNPEEPIRDVIRRHSPSGKVPALRHGDLLIWESLAICEYVAELFPEARLWPEERAARAVARAVSAEMAAGFAELRAAMPMNIRRRVANFQVPAAALVHVDRIQESFRSCRAQFGAGGPFLFGSFTIADAMYAPVVTRFRTYGVAVDEVAQAYMTAVLSLPSMQAWEEAAQAETMVVPATEAIADAAS
ncbi:glutathione S-transferase family protein [Chondromyces crocatus]|uniref:Glutathione S-transferase n=1 Tax=Chondromyces crocatus TaxID=52 RepID=A0A0K1EIT6_CHOCO|nr:glutathione S-transferase family protein [Chondromyces crocatus]AKT40775.1 glutathione S-transferase [Chondromyces crocatus]